MATIIVTNGTEKLEIDEQDLPEARADNYVPVSEYGARTQDRAGSNTSPAVVGPKLKPEAKEEETSLLGDFARNNLDALKGFPGQVARSTPIASPIAQRGAAAIGMNIDDRAYGDSLKKVQDTSKWADESYARRHPHFAGAAGLAGSMLLPLPVPKWIPKGGENAITKFGKHIANIAGGAAVPGGLMAGDAALMGKDPVLPGTLGGILGGLGAVGRAAAPGLKSMAESRALKATTGANKRELEELLRKGAVDIEGGSSLGRALLEPDEAGKPVVGLFSSPRDIAQNAKAKSEFYGEKIGQIGKTIDNVMSEMPPVSGPNIARNIRQEVSGIAPTQANAPQIKRMRGQAIDYNNRGNMTFQEGQSFKNAHRYNKGVEQGAPGSVTPRDVENVYKRSVGNEMYRAADEAAGLVGNSRAAERSLIESYPQTAKNYGMYTDATDLAENNAVRDFSNRFIRPSSYGVGGLGAIASTAAGGDPVTSIAVAAVLGGLNNVALSRGNSFVARSANGLAKVLESQGLSNPALQKYVPILHKALKNGNRSLAATHMLLLMNDPEYRQLVTEGSK